MALSHMGGVSQEAKSGWLWGNRLKSVLSMHKLFFRLQPKLNSPLPARWAYGVGQGSYRQGMYNQPRRGRGIANNLRVSEWGRGRLQPPCQRQKQAKPLLLRLLLEGQTPASWLQRGLRKSHPETGIRPRKTAQKCP